MANIRPLSPALAKKAEEELFEKPERIQDDIEILRAWILKQPHLKSRTDDQFLVTFLRGCKYSIERAKQKIDMFYTVRTALPEFFSGRNLDNPKHIEILKLGCIVSLPSPLGEDGPRISIFRTGIYDATKFNIREILTVAGAIGEILLREDDNLVVGGEVVIVDLNNVTRAHFLQFDPMLIKKMTMIGQESSPLRQKGIHYINTPTGFETVFNLFLNFMNEKAKKRVHVHGNNMESLYQHIPKKILPTEYGGEAGPVQDIVDSWVKKVQSYRDYLIEGEQYGVIENLRPGKPRTADDLFGVDGTFRKLNID